MAKATADTGKGVKMFSADIIAALLASTDRVRISKETYELMSAVDGTKTVDSLQHNFREVLAQAKDLKKRMVEGEVFVPVQPKKKGMLDDTATPTPSKKRKTPGDSDEDDTPSKKKTTPVKKQTSVKKNAPTSRGKKADIAFEEPTSDLGDELFPQDVNDFLKMEQVWEQEFA
ncbi:hypothetical protein N0V83_003886 [Neocucurbitaria cava]|uniref:Uncharacterized protein n=1 Tax=Neocucurbitaria cava TaxID=798079 RepID=A0A9W9CNI6_9PLEO|nr:hypothetical protein N0V83_003886 [Neocucurbitaria cava]